MQTLSFQAPSEMKERLETCADMFDRSKAWLIRQALEEYLADIEDYLEVKKYKEDYDASENLSLAEIKKKYKLK